MKNLNLFTKCLLFVLIYLLSQACAKEASASKGYLITAHINGLKNGTAILAKLDLLTNEPIYVDSSNIIDGAFEFIGELSNPYLHTIIINDTIGKFHLFLENSSINITGNINEMDEIKISGSREDSLFRSYPIDSIFEKKTGQEIMANYPNYVFSAFVAYYQFQIFNLDLDTMENIINNFNEPIKQSVYYHHLQALHKTIKHISIGQKAPDFTIKNTVGELINLDDFKGQYVLLDFWASWCAPCRAANPTLVEAYQQFRDKNFAIIGISVDKDEDKWLKAIDKDGLEWTNLSKLNGWNDISDLYGVKAIPQNFLINPDGIIIDKNINITALLQRLNQVLTPSK